MLDWGFARDQNRSPQSDRNGPSPDKGATDIAGRLVDPVAYYLMTQGQMVGTVAYMAPEQAERRHDLVGPRSDIFSLGAILYEILTGRPPFASGTLDEIISQARECTFDPPRQRNRTVPKALEAICLKAMAKDQADRYETAVALGDDLRRGWPTSGSWPCRNDGTTVWREKSGYIAWRRAWALSGCLSSPWWPRARPSGSASRTGEHRARERAEARLDLAVDAVRKFRETVSSNLDVRNRPDLAGLRKKLLGEPLKFFEQLREDLQKSGDTSYSTTFRASQGEF